MTEQELKASVLAKCREVWNNETNDPKVSGFRVHSNSGKYWDVHNYRRTVHYKLSDDIPADDNVWPLAAQILVIQAAKDKEIAELKAEIKRLRDGIQKGFEKLAEIPYCSVLRTIFDNANGVQNDLESLLSPAPVTETQNEDQYE